MNEINFSLPSKEFIEQNFRIILAELESLKKQIQSFSATDLKFYRNEDLKRIFKLSENTILKYRSNGILPFQKLGEIYYYPVADISKILQNNSNKGNIHNS